MVFSQDMPEERGYDMDPLTLEDCVTTSSCYTVSQGTLLSLNDLIPSGYSKPSTVVLKGSDFETAELEVVCDPCTEGWVLGDGWCSYEDCLRFYVPEGSSADIESIAYKDFEIPSIDAHAIDGIWIEFEELRAKASGKASQEFSSNGWVTLASDHWGRIVPFKNGTYGLFAGAEGEVMPEPSPPNGSCKLISMSGTFYVKIYADAYNPHPDPSRWYFEWFLYDEEGRCVWSKRTENVDGKIYQLEIDKRIASSKFEVWATAWGFGQCCGTARMEGKWDCEALWEGSSGYEAISISSGDGGEIVHYVIRSDGEPESGEWSKVVVEIPKERWGDVLGKPIRIEFKCLHRWPAETDFRFRNLKVVVKLFGLCVRCGGQQETFSPTQPSASFQYSGEDVIEVLQGRGVLSIELQRLSKTLSSTDHKVFVSDSPTLVHEVTISLPIIDGVEERVVSVSLPNSYTLTSISPEMDYRCEEGCIEFTATEPYQYKLTLTSPNRISAETHLIGARGSTLYKGEMLAIRLILDEASGGEWVFEVVDPDGKKVFASSGHLAGAVGTTDFWKVPKSASTGTYIVSIFWCDGVEAGYKRFFVDVIDQPSSESSSKSSSNSNTTSSSGKSSSNKNSDQKSSKLYTVSILAKDSSGQLLSGAVVRIYRADSAEKVAEYPVESLRIATIKLPRGDYVAELWKGDEKLCEKPFSVPQVGAVSLEAQQKPSNKQNEVEKGNILLNAAVLTGVTTTLLIFALKRRS